MITSISSNVERLLFTPRHPHIRSRCDGTTRTRIDGNFIVVPFENRLNGVILIHIDKSVTVGGSIRHAVNQECRNIVALCWCNGIGKRITAQQPRGISGHDGTALCLNGCHIEWISRENHPEGTIPCDIIKRVLRRTSHINIIHKNRINMVAGGRMDAHHSIGTVWEHGRLGLYTPLPAYHLTLELIHILSHNSRNGMIGMDIQPLIMVISGQLNAIYHNILYIITLCWGESISGILTTYIVVSQTGRSNVTIGNRLYFNMISVLYNFYL